MLQSLLGEDEGACIASERHPQRYVDRCLATSLMPATTAGYNIRDLSDTFIADSTQELTPGVNLQFVPMATTASPTETETTPQENPPSEASVPAYEQVSDPTRSGDLSRSGVFRKVWSQSTADRNLTLYGFRRFKTTHLVNLRFLEEEISDLDHRIYQAGLSLDDGALDQKTDRLGLRCSHRDANVPAIQDSITDSLVLRLRNLLKDYGQQP